MVDLSSILNDDFIWTPIFIQLTGKYRPGTGNFQYKINCPMCLLRGETVDRRYRCGIARRAESFGINCFNCKFATGYTLGRSLSHHLEAFMANIGVPERTIKLMRLRALEISQFLDTVQKVQPDFRPIFADHDLPSGSHSLDYWESVNCQDANYLAVTDYLLHRGEVAVLASRYYWTPDTEHELNRKLIIPCLHDGRIVGWIGRSIDPIKSKYYNQTPKHFLFNSKFLTQPNRKYVFIVEGIFDALVIDGVAAIGNTLNADQIQWINQCGKIPVVIPDRDVAGKQLIKIAVKQKWWVAFPNHLKENWWFTEYNVKDVDEAVRYFGKLYTLRSIVSTMINDTIDIEVRSGVFNQQSNIGSLSN